MILLQVGSTTRSLSSSVSLLLSSLLLSSLFVVALIVVVAGNLLGSPTTAFMISRVVRSSHNNIIRKGYHHFYDSSSYKKLQPFQAITTTTRRSSGSMPTTATFSIGMKNQQIVDTRSSNTTNNNDDNDSNNQMKLIDVDCNLWHVDLRKSLLPNDDDDNNDTVFRILQQDAVLESNIIAMISPSSTIKDARYGLQKLKNASENSNATNSTIHGVTIRTTVGVHPYNINDSHDDHNDINDIHTNSSTNVKDDDAMKQQQERMEECIFQEAYELIRSDRCNNRNHIVAIGECGLDGSDGFPPLPQQIPWFDAQIKLYERIQEEDSQRQQSLAFFVHERLAFNETYHMLQESSIDPSRIIIHCFTGTVEECQQYIRAGYSISISGYIFRDTAGSGSIIDCLQQNVIPLHKLLIETDAPYMGFGGTNGGGRQLFLQKNNDIIQSTLNSKQRKKIMSSTYPNVPSSLVAILYQVLEHVNIGRQQRKEDLLTPHELATITSRNSNQFFNLGLEL